MQVLLVHGMGRTSLSLAWLARFLRRAGHQVECVGYLAALESFDRIRQRVRRRLERLARGGQPYSLVGHSLGGLVLRAAAHGVEPPPAHLIMLGTPNQPPRLARRGAAHWYYRALSGESGRLLARDDFFTRLPPPTMPYTIVAGTGGSRGRWSPFGDDVNDWVVAVEETRIVSTDRPMVFPVGHTFMMNDRRVHAAIQEVLARGTP